MVDSGQSRPTAAAAASSPADSFDLRHALCDLNPSPSNASSIAGPIELFAADYDANGGRIATMVTSPARQAKANRKANRKRNLSPRKDSSKKVDATTSPVRRLRNVPGLGDERRGLGDGYGSHGRCCEPRQRYCSSSHLSKCHAICLVNSIR